MCTTIRPKVRVLINLIFLFVHDHSTKVRGHSYSLIYHCPSCANISFAIFMADTAFIIFLFQVVLLLRFVWANSWQYYRYRFRTLHSWWHCSYISYAISMAIWSVLPSIEKRLFHFKLVFVFSENLNLPRGLE